MLVETILQGLEGTPAFTPLGAQESAHGQLRLELAPQRVERPLYRPNEAMREVHHRLIEVLNWQPYAYGLQGSPAQNVRGLKGWNEKSARFLYVVDLKAAYGSVDGLRLAQVLLDVQDERDDPFWGWQQIAPDVEGMLKLLQQYFLLAGNRGLIQGGPASPLLFEIYCRELLDRPFHSNDGRWLVDFGRQSNPTWAYTQGLRYSRFADDLVFSHPDLKIGKRKRAHINAVIRGAGFSVNTAKTRRWDLAKGPVVLNGVGVSRSKNGKLRFFVPRSKLRTMEGLLHTALADPQWTNSQVVHGMMSQFLHITNLEEMNQTERRVADLYVRYRKAQGLDPELIRYARVF